MRAARPEGAGGEREEKRGRGVTRRGGERGKIRPPFFSQDSNTGANPSPTQGKGWVFCFSSLRLFCSLSVFQIVDIPLRPAASEGKQLRRSRLHESSRFSLSNRIKRQRKISSSTTAETRYESERDVNTRQLWRAANQCPRLPALGYLLSFLLQFF